MGGERPIGLTFFQSYAASKKVEATLTLQALAKRIEQETAPAKDGLPWLKLGRFGDIRTDKNSLRHDANMLSISGVEADYDGEKIPVDDAVEVLTKAGIQSIVYTSPSHTEDTPRWRVLCPTSCELSPDKRYHLVGRLNGLFQGVFARESWTLSQSYYLGSVAKNPSHRVEIIEGAPIDEMDELDEIWIGPPDTKPSQNGDYVGPLDEAALLSAIKEGRSYHEAKVRLLGRWAREGVPYMDARERINAAFQQVQENERDARWKTRFADIDRCLDDIYIKEARAKDDGKRDQGEPAGAAKATGGEQAAVRLLTPAECAAAPRRGYVIKGLMAPSDLVLIIGPPGSGKSVISPHFGYAITQERSVFGRRVKRGEVIYVAAEDPHGMRQRVAALRERFGDVADFLIVEGLSNLLDTSLGHLDQLVDIVAKRRPIAVVLDTIAAAFPGLQENESADMGKVIKAARRMTSLGAVVIAAHHVPKGDETTPRGHGVLAGDADVIIRLAPDADSGVVWGKLTKNRNGPSGAAFGFRIEATFLDNDEDGDAITAPTAIECDEGGPNRTVRLSTTEHTARTFLADLIITEGQPLPNGPGFPVGLHGAAEASWRAACDSRRLSTAEKSEDRGRVFRRVFRSLLEKHVVAARDGIVWLTTPTEQVP